MTPPIQAATLPSSGRGAALVSYTTNTGPLVKFTPEVTAIEGMTINRRVVDRGGHRVPGPAEKWVVAGGAVVRVNPGVGTSTR